LGCINPRYKADWIQLGENFSAFLLPAQILLKNFARSAPVLPPRMKSTIAPIAPTAPTAQRKTPMEPHVAQKSPYACTVEAGKDYYWGSCGQSKSQPFCDGAHKALA
jgi:hypothetical protein